MIGPLSALGGLPLGGLADGCVGNTWLSSGGCIKTDDITCPYWFVMLGFAGSRWGKPTCQCWDSRTDSPVDKYWEDSVELSLCAGKLSSLARKETPAFGIMHWKNASYKFEIKIINYFSCRLLQNLMIFCLKSCFLAVFPDLLNVLKISNSMLLS